MKLPSKHAVAWAAALIFLLIVVDLVNGLAPRPRRAQPFFGPAPTNVTLQCLGSATNDLRFDRDHRWKAFAVSNGTSQVLFYTVTEIDYRTAAGWLSNSPAPGVLMTRRESPGEILPGTSEVFYACVATSGTPWRLRVGCFEAGWINPLEKSIASIPGLPPASSKSWSGRRFELIGAEIASGDPKE